MTGQDTAVVAFAAFGLASQAVLVIYFAARRWRPRMAERYGWIAYACAGLGLPLGAWLILGGQSWRLYTGPLLLALWAALGKPIAECHALCIPTAQWGHPMCGPASVRGFIAAGTEFRYLSGLGWASLGVLELTALPTIGAERWVPWLQEADVLLVDGGDATYLCHWMRESGLADLLPSLPDTVWVGVSAGSMVMTPRIGAYFVEWPSAPDDRTLGVVNFAIFPHLDAFPTNTQADAERWAADIGIPAYAIDEQTAITVVNGTVEVVSEGHWKQFTF